MNMISEILIYLLKMGAHQEPQKITTGQIAEAVGVSQQTASRKLIELEKEGQIVREKGRILVTQASLKQIRKIIVEINQLLKGSTLIFHGKVASGLGEGAYYVKQKGYFEQIKKKLCFEPYPGTLNITIEGEEIEKRLQLREREPIVIEGFKAGKKGEQRTFGKIDAYRCSISGLPGAIIFPERSLHGLRTLEIISPFNLRKKLGLADNAEVTVEVVDNTPC
ncbi:MAG: CTP-dependent riboflavin kinase [Candidatus Micrarchaeota archaeon]|nr:CTP-dependent riboflavin kinase [Candidatus Micrarchaeota archaeon]